LSAEEFVKSFLYKCISVGLITDPEFKKDIRSHEEKMYHVIHLFLFSHVLDIRYREFLDAVDHDKLEKDHSKHLGVEALKRFWEFWRYQDDIEKITDKHLGLFKDAEKLKLKAIYVDVVKERVIFPGDAITRERCEGILNFLNIHAHGFEIILNETDEQFKELVKMADPYIYSGTMKSNFKKYKNFQNRQ
jgi:hypothetical protein